MQSQEISEKVRSLMPGVLADLEELVAIPSVSFPGFPEEPMHRMAERTLEMFREAGFTDARLMDVPSGYPPIYGELKGPEGSPVVVLYGHYDVQPAPPEQGWTSDPWTPTRREDGRIYGRGAADDISGLVSHLGMMRVFDGRPPCTVRLILEGMEETNSNLEAFVEAHPDLFACDLFVIADMGNLAVGEPALTTALRGDVACVVTVSTLEHPLHSGVFGGPAPDAMMALARLLATLHDDEGNVAVEGLHAGPAADVDYPMDRIRAESGIADGVELIGSGSVVERLWTKPAITTIGFDATRTADASNTLIPSVKAKLSVRLAPGDSSQGAMERLREHLERHVPWGAQLTFTPGEFGEPTQIDATGPAYDAARAAFRDAWDGVEPVDMGVGGSIPFIAAFNEAFPEAAVLVTGVEDPDTRAHGANEGLHLAEFERVCLAEALLLHNLAQPS